MKQENLVLSNVLIWKADVLRFSPLSERIHELWVLLVFMRVWRSFAIKCSAIAINIIPRLCGDRFTL